MRSKCRVFGSFFIRCALSLSLIAGISLQNLQRANASDYHSPRTLALGGSGHAGPFLNDSILLNPSFAAFLPTHSLSVNYLKYSGENEHHGRNYNVAVQDGMNQWFQLGVSYTKREDADFVHFGASKGFVKRFGFGIGGKYMIGTRTHPETGFDSVLSTTAIALPWLQIAFVVDNLFETEQSRVRGMRREFILGTKFNVMGIVLLYADPHWIPTGPLESNFGYEAGAEFVLLKDLFLRVGHYRNSMIPSQATYGRGYGVGLGWIAPRISFDFGFSRAFEPTLSSIYTLGTSIYF